MRMKYVMSSHNVSLINFDVEHVKYYLEWYKDKELLELTATEPMSREDLVTSQAMYAYDDDKIGMLVELTQEDGTKRIIGDASMFVDIVDDRDMGEFNVMIADKAFRRHGYSTIATCLLLLWSISELKLKEYFVKIKKSNVASIKLFESLGFVFYQYSKYFDENEYRLVVTKEIEKQILLRVMPFQKRSLV